jgi:hypothetical protein
MNVSIAKIGKILIKYTFFYCVNLVKINLFLNVNRHYA